MSQYPSPYQPPVPTGPMYGYDPALDAALAPARRAGILMFILGGLLFLGGVCCVGVGALLPQLMQQQPEAFRELENMPEGVTIEMIRTAIIAVSAAGIVYALAFVVLGIFVRKGSTGAIITTLIMSVLAVLLLAFWTLSGLLGGSAGNPMAAVCIFALPLALHVLLIVWLIQAIRAGGEVAAARSQSMQQYWQYAYQQQTHQQAFPPRDPPFPPPPPPPPQG